MSSYIIHDGKAFIFQNAEQKKEFLEFCKKWDADRGQEESIVSQVLRDVVEEKSFIERHGFPSDLIPLLAEGETAKSLLRAVGFREDINERGVEAGKDVYLDTPIGLFRFRSEEDLGWLWYKCMLMAVGRSKKETTGNVFVRVLAGVEATQRRKKPEMENALDPQAIGIRKENLPVVLPEETETEIREKLGGKLFRMAGGQMASRFIDHDELQERMHELFARTPKPRRRETKKRGGLNPRDEMKRREF